MRSDTEVESINLWIKRVVQQDILNSSKKSFGSHWSSFPWTAAEINSLERVTIRTNKFSLKPFVSAEFPLLVKLHAGIEVSESDCGEIIVNSERDKEIKLNQMSAAILNLCSQSMTVREIVQVFIKQYPGQIEVVEQSVIEAMELFLIMKLITVKRVYKQ